MDCKITIIQNDTKITRTLKQGWGTKFSDAWKAEDGRRIKAVLQVAGDTVNGFLKIKSDTIGLPTQTLENNQTSWPAAFDGLIVNVEITSDELKPLNVRSQTAKKQWWGVFKSTAECKCKKIGPENAKPKAPSGYSNYGFHNNDNAAERELTKCTKSLKCKPPINTTQRQWWGVFMDAPNCKCQLDGPSIAKPPTPPKMALYKYYNTEAQANDGLAKCKVLLPSNCQVAGATMKTISGVVELRPVVTGQLSTAVISIAVTGSGITDFLMHGAIEHPPSNQARLLLETQLSTTSLDLIRGSIVYNGLVLKLEDANIDSLGSNLYAAHWHNRSLPRFGIFDVKFTGLVS